MAIERGQDLSYYRGCRAMLELIPPKYYAASLERLIAEFEDEAMDRMAQAHCTCEGDGVISITCPVHCENPIRRVK